MVLARNASSDLRFQHSTALNELLLNPSPKARYLRENGKVGNYSVELLAVLEICPIRRRDEIWRHPREIETKIWLRFCQGPSGSGPFCGRMQCYQSRRG